MKIEDDSSFIKHFTHSGKEFVSLSHYLEVWRNGYSVDGYIIGTDDIYFESASYNGFDPNKIHAGTYIMKKQYLRWEKKILQAKEKAIMMLQQTATPINRKLKVGDFIFYTWIDDEEDEEFREDNAYYGMKIVEIKDDRLYAQDIYIGKYYFDSRDKIDCHEDLSDILSSSRFITDEVFMASHEYMRNFCRQLLDEIKSHVHYTEQA